MSAKNQKGSPSEPGFDERLTQLEGLVSQLEEGDLDLEAAIDRYQAGIDLLKSCHATLGTYRARIEELSAEAGVTVAALRDPDLDPAGEPEA